MKKHLFVVILALSAFSIKADGVNLTCSPFQSCINCPEYQTLFPIKQFYADDSSVEVEADQSEISQNDEYLLSGNVQLKSGDYLLSADEVQFSGSNQTTIAQSNIEYQDTEYLITGDNFSAIKENGQTKAKINNTRYQEIKNNANGIAESISKEGDIVIFNKATYSYCPINQSDWHVYSRKIRANFDTNRGVADNASLFFKGFPIFYVPIFSWVLEGRGSGFLAPDFETYGEHIGNTQESKVRIPYYFNIAPDRDLVLAYTLLSSRGSVIETKYRQLIDRKESKSGYEDSIFEIESQYLFNDDIRKMNRWLVDTKTELNISNNIHLSARYNKVSDKNYFKEILHRNTDAERLNSHLKISYKYPKINLNAEFLTEDEQIVNDGSSNYTRAIQASVSKRFNAAGVIPYGVSVITTKFKHDDANKDSGVRIHGTIAASKSLSRKFPIIDSSVNATSTLYSLNNKDNITRTTFGSNLDLTFPFISQREFFNAQTTRTITPKITYNYRGKVVQGNIPIFDTTDKHDEALTFAGLTSGERYTGLDRISNANDLTLSLVTNYSDLNSNKDLFNFRIAQSYYADDEVVSNETNTDFEKRRSYSDIVASIDLAINQFAYNSSLQFDPEINKVTNRTNSISYKLNPKKFVSLTHTKDDSTSTAKLYGVYPVSDSIHLFGAINQNITTGKTTKGAAGLTYDSCCWAMRGAYFDEGASNYGIGFEIILKGIGSSSTNLGKRIKQHIPYYDANLDE